MNTPLKLAAFGAGLVAVFGAAAGLGAVVGPVGPAAEDSSPAGHDMAPDHEDDAAHQDDAAHLPASLSVSDDGYTLALEQSTLPAGADVPLTFRVLGPDGHAVTDYAVRHEEDLHLIAVRRDLSGYQHVHPEPGADGTWRVPLDLSPGTWRVFADFAASADGEDRTLGAYLQVDGYEVTLDGDLVAGEESELALTVTRDGAPVTDLQPYLGAYGHLVALRTGDLAYLHVHPTGEPGDGVTPAGPAVTFAATVGAHEEHGP